MSVAKSTTTEAEMREWAQAGKNWVDLARKIGRPHSAVLQAASILGIRSANWSKAPKPHHADWVAKLERGVFPTDLAREARITLQALQMSLKRAGLPTTIAAAVRAKYDREQAEKSPGVDIDRVHRRAAAVEAS